MWRYFFFPKFRPGHRAEISHMNRRQNSSPLPGLYEEALSFLYGERTSYCKCKLLFKRDGQAKHCNRKIVSFYLIDCVLLSMEICETVLEP